MDGTITFTFLQTGGWNSWYARARARTHTHIYIQA